MADMFTELDRALRREPACSSGAQASCDTHRARKRPAPAVSNVVDMRTTAKRVREVTHCGSFYNVREIVLAEITPATVAGMLREAPYVVSHGPAIKSIHDQLAAVGRASHGWTDWEVVR